MHAAEIDKPQTETAGRPGADPLSPTAAKLIRAYADSILALKKEIKELQDEISAEFAAAKSQGLDRAALAELVRRLGCDRNERHEQELIATLYETAYQQAGMAEYGLSELRPGLGMSATNAAGVSAREAGHG